MKIISRVLLCLVLSLGLFIAGCNSSSSDPSPSAAETEAATDQDRAALLKIVGQRLPVPEDIKSQYESYNDDLSLENGAEENFLTTTLTLQEGRVTYNNLSYEYLGSEFNGDSLIHTFSRELASPSHNEEIQIVNSSGNVSYFLVKSKLLLDQEHAYEALSSGNATSYYVDGDDVLATLEYNNFEIHKAFSSISYNSNELESGEASYKIPFIFTISDIAYSGSIALEYEFVDEEVVSGTSEVVSALRRDGIKIGEMRLATSNGEIEIFVYNSDLVLEKLTAE